MDEAKGYHRGAIFTVELGCLVENGYDLGMRSYPIFDEAYRDLLNGKIIEHFWFREIGLETPALFKRFLNRKLNEVMPYYNQLYKSCLLDFDPLVNSNIVTTGNTENTVVENRNTDHSEKTNADSTAKQDSDTHVKSRALVSQTPQMQLSGREDYATNITDTETNTHVEGKSANITSSVSSLEELVKANTDNASNYQSKVLGLSGITASAALQEWRTTFMNIDMLVIDELNELFMGLYTDYWNAL